MYQILYCLGRPTRDHTIVMTHARIIIDKRRANARGEYPLQVELAHMGRRYYVGLAVRVTLSQWRDGRVVNHPHAARLNILLSRYLLDIDEAILEWRENRELPTLSADEMRHRVRCIIHGEDYRSPRKKGTLFLEHYRTFAATHEGRTLEVYQHTERRLKQWDPSNIELMTLEEITPEWLARLDAFLAQTAKSANSRAVHMRNIRAAMNDAIMRELTTNYPFRWFKVKHQPTEHRALTVEQLRELWGAAVHPHEHDYLDMFKLMFLLCGISPVDLFHLPADAMRHGRISTRRSKTGQPIDIKLEPEALELIGKHRGTNYLVDVLDRHKDYRNYLKRMGEALKSMGGVTYEYRKTRDGKHRVVAVRRITWPKLSPYWARHTWASIAYSIGVPIDVIGQAMGHSDRRVTEIYIAKDSSRVDEANRRVIDWVLYQRR